MGPSCLRPPRSSSPGSRSSGAAPAHPRRLPARPACLPRGRWRPAVATTSTGPLPPTWQHHLAALRRTHGVASVARALSSIRGFHRFLVEEGARERRPHARPAARPVTDLLPKALSEEEAGQLLGAVVGDGPAGAARPGPARGALRHRRPGERGGRAEPGRRRRRRGLARPAAGARARQGRQGAGRPARPAGPRRAGGLAVGAGPPARRAQAMAPAQRRRGACS